MTQDTYDNEYDETPQRLSIPNTVLLPALTLALAGAVAALSAILNARDSQLGPAVFLGSVAAACAVVAVGLWRGSRMAHTAAYPLAALIALTLVGRGAGPSVLGVGFATGIISALSVRSAKDWFGIR